MHLKKGTRVKIIADFDGSRESNPATPAIGNATRWSGRYGIVFDRVLRPEDTGANMDAGVRRMFATNQFLRKMKTKVANDVSLTSALRKEYLVVPEPMFLDVIDKRLLHPWTVRVSIRQRDDRGKPLGPE